MIPVNSTTLNKLPFYGIVNQTIRRLENKLKKLESYTSTTSTTQEPNTTLAVTSTLSTSTVTHITTVSRRYTVPPRPPIDPAINRSGRTHETNAAITIIIISAVLIVIIVITILVLLFNRKNVVNYKIESHKTFNDNENQMDRKPCSVLLPKDTHTHTQSNLLIQPSNANNNLRIVGKVKKRQDVKEWYV